jgi:hypothetical protein
VLTLQRLFRRHPRFARVFGGRRRDLFHDHEITVVLWQIERGKYLFHFVQKLAYIHGSSPLFTCVVSFGSAMDVPVPAAIQFITRIQSLTVVDQRKIRGLIAVIAIDLNKQIGGNIQTDLYQAQSLFEHIHADKVLAPLQFLPQNGGQFLRFHDFFCKALSRLISAFMSAMPVTASSQSK